MYVCMYVCTYVHPAIWLHLRLTWSFQSSGQVANCHPLLQSQRSVLDPGRPETRSDEVDWKFESLLRYCSFFMGFKQKHSWDTYIYIYIYIHILRYTKWIWWEVHCHQTWRLEIPRRNSVGYTKFPTWKRCVFQKDGKTIEISRILWNIVGI